MLLAGLSPLFTLSLFIGMSFKDIRCLEHYVSQDIFSAANREIICDILACYIMRRGAFDIRSAGSPDHDMAIADARIETDLLRPQRIMDFDS